jgi:hypothetical protein
MGTFHRLPLLMGALFAGLPLLGGCSSNDRDDRPRSSRDSRVSRDYDYDRYDRASQAGERQGPWRDEDGNLHHPPGWKAASDRGRDSNDRDARFDRY